MSSVWGELRTAGVAGYRLDLGPDLVRLPLASGDLALADAAAAEVEQVAAMNVGLDRTRATALLCRGLVAASPTTLRDAASLLERCPRPFEAARACEEAGAALAGAGRPAAARDHYERALRLYEGLEAWRAVGRVEARMRRHGLRRSTRSRPARPRTGWASLTATERTVAELAANGLTNPQIAARLFVSHHTVHTHVGHVLAKLQLASRVELAAEAAIRRTKDVRQDPEELQPTDEGYRRSALDGHPS